MKNINICQSRNAFLVFVTTLFLVCCLTSWRAEASQQKYYSQGIDFIFFNTYDMVVQSPGDSILYFNLSSSETFYDVAAFTDGGDYYLSQPNRIWKFNYPGTLAGEIVTSGSGIFSNLMGIAPTQNSSLFGVDTGLGNIAIVDPSVVNSVTTFSAILNPTGYVGGISPDQGTYSGYGASVYSSPSDDFVVGVNTAGSQQAFTFDTKNVLYSPTGVATAINPFIANSLLLALAGEDNFGNKVVDLFSVPFNSTSATYLNTYTYAINGNLGDLRLLYENNQLSLYIDVAEQNEGTLFYIDQVSINNFYGMSLTNTQSKFGFDLNNSLVTSNYNTFSGITASTTNIPELPSGFMGIIGVLMAGLVLQFRKLYR